jgi:hypothetical protein
MPAAEKEQRAGPGVARTCECRMDASSQRGAAAFSRMRERDGFDRSLADARCSS